MPVVGETTRQEIVRQVGDFVKRKYAGDFRRAFDAEDENGDGLLSRDEVAVILAKAGVGLRLTRWAIALEIIEVMDSNGDGMIAFAEFEQMAK